MIVRRITAGAAGLALVGTAFAVAPASAKNQGETQITLNGGFVQNLTADGVKLSVVKPAKSKKGVVTLPIVNRAGVQIVHEGAIKFTGTAGFVSLNRPHHQLQDRRHGRHRCDHRHPAPGLTIASLAKLTGGKKNAKKGFWKNANLEAQQDDRAHPGRRPHRPRPAPQHVAGQHGDQDGSEARQGHDHSEQVVQAPRRGATGPVPVAPRCLEGVRQHGPVWLTAPVGVGGGAA